MNFMGYRSHDEDQHRHDMTKGLQAFINYLGRHDDLTDVDFANMEDTPKRFVKAFMEMTRTRTEIRQEVKDIIATSFPASNVPNHKPGIITQGPIEAVSICPHHWLTVKYEVFVAYIPGENGGVLGLSKLARLVIALARRPVLQEDFTKDIADILHWENHDYKSHWPSVDSFGSAVRVIGVHSCFDGDTEILTENGWTKFKHLQDNVRVAQVDVKNGMKTSLVLPMKVIRQKNGFDHLLHFKNRCVDLMVTPDHNLITSSSWKYNHNNGYFNWEFIPANKVPVEFYVPKQIEWDEKTPIKAVNIDGHRIEANDFIKLMALYFSEGCWRGEGSWLHYARNKVGIEIVQKKGTPECDKMISFFNTLPFRIDRELQDGAYHFIIHSTDLPKYLLKFGRLCVDMRLPRILLNAPKKQQRLFLKWFYLGDGDKWHLKQEHKDKFERSRGQIISTASKKLARDLQELYFKCGMDTHIHTYEGADYQNGGNKYRVWQQLGKGQNNTQDGKQAAFFRTSSTPPEIIPYTGMVYCVTVPTSAIIVRRNGLITVVGNCMSCRGVHSNAKTVTAELRGDFRKVDMEEKFDRFIEDCRRFSSY